ncbi:MAG: hypothetical protein HOB02_04575 [Proteobacteria bacterium]|nr:hypothetical protein [Pseudomonadota bacterium]
MNYRRNSFTILKLGSACWVGTISIMLIVQLFVGSSITDLTYLMAIILLPPVGLFIIWASIFTVIDLFSKNWRS